MPACAILSQLEALSYPLMPRNCLSCQTIVKFESDRIRVKRGCHRTVSRGSCSGALSSEGCRASGNERRPAGCADTSTTCVPPAPLPAKARHHPSTVVHALTQPSRVRDEPARQSWHALQLCIRCCGLLCHLQAHYGHALGDGWLLRSQARIPALACTLDKRLTCCVLRRSMRAGSRARCAVTGW